MLLAFFFFLFFSISISFYFLLLKGNNINYYFIFQNHNVKKQIILVTSLVGAESILVILTLFLTNFSILVATKPNFTNLVTPDDSSGKFFCFFFGVFSGDCSFFIIFHNKERKIARRSSGSEKNTFDPADAHTSSPFAATDPWSTKALQASSLWHTRHVFQHT